MTATEGSDRGGYPSTSILSGFYLPKSQNMYMFALLANLYFNLTLTFSLILSVLCAPLNMQTLDLSGGFEFLVAVVAFASVENQGFHREFS